MLEQRIQQQFFDSADLKYAAAEVLSKPIADAVSALVGCITGGGKVLACGNGGSAADAQHFAAEFVGRFERERPGLAAIALTVDTSILTAVANDYGYDGGLLQAGRGARRAGRRPAGDVDERQFGERARGGGRGARQGNDGDRPDRKRPAADARQADRADVHI